MKDEQGTNIINPETMKIIRNLHAKAMHEGEKRDFYINQLLADNVLDSHIEGRTHMDTIEQKGQEWCIEQDIIGYEYICGINTETRRKRKNR